MSPPLPTQKVKETSRRLERELGLDEDVEIGMKTAMPYLERNARIKVVDLQNLPIHSF